MRLLILCGFREGWRLIWRYRLTMNIEMEMDLGIGIQI